MHKHLQVQCIITLIFKENPGNYSQPHLDLWEGNGAANPGNHFQVQWGQENHQEQSAQLHQGEGLADEGRAVNTGSVDFSKTLNQVSQQYPPTQAANA